MGVNNSLRNSFERFKHWFNSGGDYNRFNSTRFFLNLDFLNGYELLFLKIGSTLFLVGIFFILRYVYYIGKQLKKGHTSLRNGHKIIIALLVITCWRLFIII